MNGLTGWLAVRGLEPIRPVRLRKAAEQLSLFDEQRHPRAADGKFTSGSSAGKAERPAPKRGGAGERMPGEWKPIAVTDEHSGQCELREMRQIMGMRPPRDLVAGIRQLAEAKGPAEYTATLERLKGERGG